MDFTTGHTVDGQNPAPPKKPWHADSPVNTSRPWFQPCAGAGLEELSLIPKVPCLTWGLLRVWILDCFNPKGTLQTGGTCPDPSIGFLPLRAKTTANSKARGAAAEALAASALPAGVASFPKSRPPRQNVEN